MTKDYAVVTISLKADRSVIHTYGPYTQREANRMSKQLSYRHPEVLVYARKLLDNTEVDAKPANPKG